MYFWSDSEPGILRSEPRICFGFGTIAFHFDAVAYCFGSKYLFQYCFRKKLKHCLKDNSIFIVIITTLYCGCYATINRCKFTTIFGFTRGSDFWESLSSDEYSAFCVWCHLTQGSSQSKYKATQCASSHSKLNV